MKHSFILDAFYSTPWAILPEKLRVLQAVVHRHAAGEKLSAEEIAAVKAAQPAPRSAGAVAVLPLFGSIFPRANLMTEMSGATSAERWGAQLRATLADPSVGAIVIDVDSPGGAVSGVDELAAEIFAARGAKPVLAVANHLAASAAYWIATAADELAVTPSGEVGSIGVFGLHEDYSKMDEMLGVKTTLISAGKYKTEGNPYEPLGDEARAAMQARVNEYYDMFAKAVARNRGVSVADVRNGFGEGRVVGARQAVSLGMADRVATLDETIQRAMKLMRKMPMRGAAADADYHRRRIEVHKLRNAPGSVETR